MQTNIKIDFNIKDPDYDHVEEEFRELFPFGKVGAGFQVDLELGDPRLDMVLDELQRRGILIMRDASANKCGVISSSYEIIANLLLTEKEFLANKQQYVADVLDILAEDDDDLECLIP